MLSLIFAHPYPDRSRAGRRLFDAATALPNVEARSLYDLYPDFGIDVAAEQDALRRADAVVWQHPMYWYSVPGLLKHWFDKVLTRGFAYGGTTAALRDKRCLWVVTTGGDESAFRPDGMHAHELSAFVPHVRQTAEFCGMHWEEPIVVHAAHRIDDATLDHAASRYRDRLAALLDTMNDTAKETSS